MHAYLQIIANDYVRMVEQSGADTTVGLSLRLEGFSLFWSLSFLIKSTCSDVLCKLNCYNKLPGDWENTKYPMKMPKTRNVDAVIRITKISF